MKQRHVAGAKSAACATLEWCGINRGADFHTLSSDQVDMLIRAADQDRYRKPPRANGSRARYFHDLLQRRARRVEP